jgi:hypothetical protein
MITQFILCGTQEEADQIAARLELRKPWQWLHSPTQIHGARRPLVWRTPCWFYGRPETVKPMWEQLRATQAQMGTVACTTHRPLAVNAEEPPTHPAL